MRSFPWPGDDGWPYRDSDGIAADYVEDLDAADAIDDDLISLHALPSRVLASLDPLERQVISARFGLGGSPVRSMRELHQELGVPRADLRVALGSGLDKLRTRLR